MKEEYDFSAAQPVKGRKLPARDRLDQSTKERITIMVDLDILEFFREQARRPGSDGYQTLINKALRIYMTELQQGSAIQQLKAVLLNDRAFIQSIAHSLMKRPKTGEQKKLRTRPES